MSLLTTHPGATPAVDADRGAAAWRALGTYVDLRTSPDAVHRAVEIAVAVIAEVDAACSRFREDSDISRANLAAGTPVVVAPVLLAAVRVALEAAEQTGGVVDPTLGEVLVSAGYDRTFDLVPADAPGPAALPRPRPRKAWRTVRVSQERLLVPPGAALDLGATGKAFAADLVALAVVDELDTSVLVSVGGDVRVASPDGGPAATAYPVVLGHRLADLAAGGPSARARISRGGLATSSTSARRWRRGGRAWHHLIDPRTGEPATGPWRTVTALGHTATAANTASTAAIVLGDDALRWLVERDVAARLVDHDGHVIRTPAWTASDIEETS